MTTQGLGGYCSLLFDIIKSSLFPLLILKCCLNFAHFCQGFWLLCCPNSFWRWLWRLMLVELSYCKKQMELLQKCWSGKNNINVHFFIPLLSKTRIEYYCSVWSIVEFKINCCTVELSRLENYSACVRIRYIESNLPFQIMRMLCFVLEDTGVWIFKEALSPFVFPSYCSQTSGFVLPSFAPVLALSGYKGFQGEGEDARVLK